MMNAGRCHGQLSLVISCKSQGRPDAACRTKHSSCQRQRQRRPAPRWMEQGACAAISVAAAEAEGPRKTPQRAGAGPYPGHPGVGGPRHEPPAVRQAQPGRAEPWFDAVDLHEALLLLFDDGGRALTPRRRCPPLQRSTGTWCAAPMSIRALKWVLRCPFASEAPPRAQRHQRAAASFEARPAAICWAWAARCARTAA